MRREPTLLLFLKPSNYKASNIIIQKYPVIPTIWIFFSPPSLAPPLLSAPSPFPYLPYPSHVRGWNCNASHRCNIDSSWSFRILWFYTYGWLAGWPKAHADRVRIYNALSTHKNRIPWNFGRVLIFV